MFKERLSNICFWGWFTALGALINGWVGIYCWVIMLVVHLVIEQNRGRGKILWKGLLIDCLGGIWSMVTFLLREWIENIQMPF